MSIVKKIAFTLAMMLIWGVGKEVAQKLQGAHGGLLTWIVSTVCITIILDIWYGFLFFSKKSDMNLKNDQNE